MLDQFEDLLAEVLGPRNDGHLVSSAVAAEAVDSARAMAKRRSIGMSSEALYRLEQEVEALQEALAS